MSHTCLCNGGLERGIALCRGYRLAILKPVPKRSASIPKILAKPKSVPIDEIVNEQFSYWIELNGPTQMKTLLRRVTSSLRQERVLCLSGIDNFLIYVVEGLLTPLLGDNSCS